MRKNYQKSEKKETIRIKTPYLLFIVKKYGVCQHSEAFVLFQKEGECFFVALTVGCAQMLS